MRGLEFRTGSSCRISTAYLPIYATNYGAFKCAGEDHLGRLSDSGETIETEFLRQRWQYSKRFWENHRKLIQSWSRCVCNWRPMVSMTSTDPTLRNVEKSVCRTPTCLRCVIRRSLHLIAGSLHALTAFESMISYNIPSDLKDHMLRVLNRFAARPLNSP